MNFKNLLAQYGKPFALLLFIWAAPFIFNDYLMHVILMVSIFGFLTLGLNMLFGYTGQISIGQAGFYAIGAYLSSILEVKLGCPWYLAWAAAIASASLVAWVIGWPVLRLKGHYLAMATIAFGLIIEAVAVQWLPVTGGHDGIYIPSSRILSGVVAGNLYFISGTLLAVAYLACENLVNTRIGRALKAVRDDELGAQSLGIDVARIKVMMFVLSGVFSAFAGIMYAHATKMITPEVFGLNTSITILVMVVIGGMGSNTGALLGAAFVTVLPELLYGFQNFNILVYGLLVILCLVFAPKGVVGLSRIFAGRGKSGPAHRLDTG
ncbi:MAG: branched-chain amino acid ABC transporter permease [Eubacteriales bacterium]